MNSKQPKYKIGDQVYFIESSKDINRKYETCKGMVTEINPAWDGTFSYVIITEKNKYSLLEKGLTSNCPEEIVNLCNKMEYIDILNEITLAEFYKEKIIAGINKAEELFSSDLLNQIFVEILSEKIKISDKMYKLWNLKIGPATWSRIDVLSQNKINLLDFIEKQKDLLQYVQTNLENLIEKKIDFEETLSNLFQKEVEESFTP